MVYVDDMLMSATVDNGGRGVKGKWSHLTATTEEELHAFAAQLGLRRSWFQPAKLFPDNAYNRERGQVGAMRSRFHYDVVERVRQKAIALGAVPLHYGSEQWMDLYSHNWRADNTNVAGAVARRTADEAALYGKLAAARQALAVAQNSEPPLFRLDNPEPELLDGEHAPC